MQKKVPLVFAMGTLRIFLEYIFMVILIFYLLNLLLFPKEEGFHFGLKVHVCFWGLNLTSIFQPLQAGDQSYFTSRNTYRYFL